MTPPKVCHQSETKLTLVVRSSGFSSFGSLPAPSSTFGDHASFKILFCRFADLPSVVGEYTASPEFTYNGNKWRIRIYPGGDILENVGFLSLSLHHCERASTSFERVSASFSPSADTASFQVSILDKHQNVKFKKEMKHGSRGWNRICARSIVLDQPNNFLDDIGTLAIVVSSKNDAASPYVPSNPMSDIITGMFLDEDTADVRFEVSCASADSNEEDGDETASSPVTLATFHAHRSILKGCAPMLALLFGTTDEKIATASITDVEPDIFHHMLYYVYGGSVPDGEMNAHAKKIIDAADKYSIVNLKLAAETAYVKSTEITMENAVDILLYADALNLALLKEVVIDFLVENSEEATEKISFADVSGTLMKDLLVAISREKDEMKGRNQDGKVFTTMRVSELRAKLAEIGLGVDGSRESMIKALEIETNNSLFGAPAPPPSESLLVEPAPAPAPLEGAPIGLSFAGNPYPFQASASIRFG